MWKVDFTCFDRYPETRRSLLRWKGMCRHLQTNFNFHTKTFQNLKICSSKVRRMTDSVTGSLLNRGSLRTSLCDLPTEMLFSIFEHSDLVSLMQLSATCHTLRHQVHENFTMRIEAQGKKYPEVKQSLDRLNWKKKHGSLDCKCFKMMAGPGFIWSELEELRSFSVVCHSNLPRTSTIAAGKTFFATSPREVSYADLEPGGRARHKTLCIFNDDVYGHSLASYDNVLAIVVKVLVRIESNIPKFHKIWHRS